MHVGSFHAKFSTSIRMHPRLAISSFLSHICVTFADKSACCVEDMNILSAENVLISDILICSSKLGDSEHDITPCMQEAVPAFGSISNECVLCTNEIMYLEESSHCLADCISDLTSGSCKDCTPKLASLWKSRCDKGSGGPSNHVSHPINSTGVCTASDQSIVRSGSHFVIESMNCLKDLSTFRTCLYGVVPEYGEITPSCKVCAAGLSTTWEETPLSAQDCGAICMQSSDKCDGCARGIAKSFDSNCLQTTSLVDSGAAIYDLKGCILIVFTFIFGILS
jgi:hypothetical protein